LPPELHPVVEALAEDGWDVVVDVGAGDGRHAVAVARRAAGAIVHAFDVDPATRRFLRDAAAEGGVAARVGIAAGWRAGELDALLHGRALVLCHGEEHARTTLDPEAVPALRGATIAVALRDGPTSAAALSERFAATHVLRVADAAIGGWVVLRPR
jgi:hypothetical protein